MDRKAFRKEYLLNLITSPVTIGPFLAGVTALGAGVALSMPLAALGGLVGIVLGPGIAITRFTLESDKLAEETRIRVQSKEQEKRTARLDKLYTDLHYDDDPRTEQLLQELREITKVLRAGFEQNEPWARALSGRLTHDVMSLVNKLFYSCVDQLEQSLALYRKVDDLNHGPAREALEARRRDLITEVEASVQSLTGIVSGIQDLEPVAAPATDTTLSSIRHELEERLRIDKKVRQQQRDMLNPEVCEELLEEE